MVKLGLDKNLLTDICTLWAAVFPDAKDKKQLSGRLPYATLFNNFKRMFLKAVGFNVPITAVIRCRIPIQAQDGDTDNDTVNKKQVLPESKGAWRMQVLIKVPFDAHEDNDTDEPNDAFISNAAYEAACGPPGLPEFEVNTITDSHSLDCPDKVSTSEWDAVWPYLSYLTTEDLKSATYADDLDEALLSKDILDMFLPESQGGMNNRDFDNKIPKKNKNLVGPDLDNLDPTQASFVTICRNWRRDFSSQLLALLVGTAGTGKTATLKVAIQELQQQGLKKYVVGAYTGVAACNIGMSGRTLHEIFRLYKTLDASGELAPLEGEDLDKFCEELDDCELLVVDEVSMLSKILLANIHTRLQEWRHHRQEHELARQIFGGLSVILAGDFGQLPPVAVSPVLSLLHDKTVPDAMRQSKTANLGRRLFMQFTTCTRLRRVHRQPGASKYKESLLRLRDGAMTLEDHELWCSHDELHPTCTFTKDEKLHLQSAPHLFAENKQAGERNGEQVGKLCEASQQGLWRVMANDSCQAASHQS